MLASGSSADQELEVRHEIYFSDRNKQKHIIIESKIPCKPDSTATIFLPKRSPSIPSSTLEFDTDFNIEKLDGGFKTVCGSKSFFTFKNHFPVEEEPKTPLVPYFNSSFFVFPTSYLIPKPGNELSYLKHRIYFSNPGALKVYPSNDVVYTANNLSASYMLGGNFSTYQVRDLLLRIDRNLDVDGWTPELISTIKESKRNIEDFFSIELKNKSINLIYTKNIAGIRGLNLEDITIFSSIPDNDFRKSLYKLSLVHELTHYALGHDRLQVHSLELDDASVVAPFMEGLTDFYALMLNYSSIFSPFESSKIIDEHIKSYKSSFEGLSSYETFLSGSNINLTLATHLLIRRWLQEGVITQDRLDSFTRNLPREAVNAQDLYALMKEGLGAQTVSDFQYYIVEGNDVLEGIKKPLTFRGSHQGAEGL